MGAVGRSINLSKGQNPRYLITNLKGSFTTFTFKDQLQKPLETTPDGDKLVAEVIEKSKKKTAWVYPNKKC